MTEWLAEFATARETLGLRRRVRVRTADEDLLDLAGNDYLGLSRHPDVVEAAVAALWTWGTGATASRLVSGTTSAHASLEAALAAYAGTPSALVFSSGYLANLGAVAALAGRGDLVVSDAYAHASLVDACRLSRARVVVADHADPDAVAKALADRSEERALVLTESVFSVDGDVPPLRDLHEACRTYGALLLVDAAHGFGVVDPVPLAGEPDVVVTVTLSKALGGQGGAVLASREVVAHLVDVARTFMFDTGLAPASAAAAEAALAVLANDPSLAARARANARSLARIAGVPAPVAAVVSVPMPSPAAALDAAAAMRGHGVRAGVFRPPSVPDGISRLRLTARADLTATDLARVETALRAAL